MEQAILLAPDPILILDKSGVSLFHNPAAASFFNVEPKALLNCHLGIPIAPEDGEQLINSTSGRVAQLRASKIDWQSNPCWFVILRDVTEQIQTAHDLTEAKSNLESANQQLYETSISDELTGLLNRRGFEAELWREISRTRRYGGNICAILIDCDEFKAINTRFGHAGGDEALKHIANIIEKSTRTTDVVSRIGGDEFLVLLPETRQAEGEIVAEKIRMHVSESQALTQAGPIQVSISAGVATIPQSTSTIESILRILQDALSLGKNTGRNRVISSDEACLEMPSIDTLMKADFFVVCSTNR
jgi:diguanylate cyclase (GGDEF)-like protein